MSDIHETFSFLSVCTSFLAIVCLLLGRSEQSAIKNLINDIAKSGDLNILLSNSNIKLLPIIGNTGDKGEIGDKGITGDIGDIGPTGDSPIGLMGDKGIKGETGDTGDMGVTGFAGGASNATNTFCYKLDSVNDYSLGAIDGGYGTNELFTSFFPGTLTSGGYPVNLYLDPLNTDLASYTNILFKKSMFTRIAYVQDESIYTVNDPVSSFSEEVFFIQFHNADIDGKKDGYTEITMEMNINTTGFPNKDTSTQFDVNTVSINPKLYVHSRSDNTIPTDYGIPSANIYNSTVFNYSTKDGDGVLNVAKTNKYYNNTKKVFKFVIPFTPSVDYLIITPFFDITFGKTVGDAISYTPTIQDLSNSRFKFDLGVVLSVKTYFLSAFSAF